MAILSEIVHYVILNTFSRMVICFWLLSLGDIRHLSCQFQFFCFIVILDWLGVALSNFHHCMLTWWRSHSSIYVKIDLLVWEWKWKQKNDIYGNTVSEHIFFFGKSFRTSFLSHDDELGLNLFRKIWLRCWWFLFIKFWMWFHMTVAQSWAFLRQKQLKNRQHSLLSSKK